MGFANGLIPLASLGRTKTGHRLRADAAVSYDRMDTAFRRDLGSALGITDAYRDLIAQFAVKAAKPTLAAKPGTSVHGWGLALDLGSGVPNEGSAAHRWMDAHGHEYGWVNPRWAQDHDPDNGAHEPWHWEYVPALDQHAGGTLTARLAIIDPEDDMPTAQEIAAAILDTPVLREGLAAGGATTLRQQIAWSDDHTMQITRAIGLAVPTIVAGVLDAPVLREGLGAGGATTLRQQTAWTDDHTMQLARALAVAVPTIVAGVLNTPIPKGGRFAGNVTTLAAVASWHDEHIVTLAEGIEGVAVASPVVDQTALAAAITATVQESLESITHALAAKPGPG